MIAVARNIKTARAFSRLGCRLSGDARAATALEFGLVVIPFMALIMASLQIGITFFAQQTIESVAEVAGRKLMTGQPQNAGTTAANFKTAMCAQLPIFMTCSKLMIDVQKSSTFAGSSTSSPTITYDASGNPNNSWSYDTGKAGDIITLRVMYPWSVMSGPLGFDISTMSGSRRLLLATSVFKTEAY